MAPEELLFMGFFSIYVPVGVLFRYLSPQAKKGAALSLGLLMTIGTCGIHTLHSLCTVLGTWLLIRVNWRKAPPLSLGWTFLYLFFFRTGTWIGLPPPELFPNIIQLLLTLKMVSLAYEVRSYHFEKEKEVSSFSKSPVIGRLSHEPSLYDIISYSYCYVGLMIGTFFRYQTYVDWLEQTDPLSLPCKVPCLSKLKMVPVYAALALGVDFLFPVSYVRTDDFLDHNFFFRFFYMVAVCFAFRMKFYFAWHGAEAGCITAGLGCYPKGAESKPGCGPTVQYSPEPGALVEYDFRTIQNIDCYNTDFCVKVRQAMRHWNMTVQWWLHQYIYSNAPFRAYTLRAGWTMLVSAFWHGLDAGYYLSFLTIPVCIAAELSMESCVRARLGAEGQKMFDWVHWFLKMRTYDYICMSYVLLNASDTLHYWSSIYFLIHVVAFICIAAGRLIGGGKKERMREEREK
ncbi:lysophospholipid acyltransferase 7 [Ictalurus punctatus]|uniref:Leukocyte receptor cluster member 4 n=1 Tax=Ictalurus punctatus TaxID=7998 RepID=A0A2D0QUE5_ICTPU|nr:lysophospholipid acyltransferase 7 [Ictalurus punctatus]